jgi:hypothetical protein
VELICDTNVWYAIASGSLAPEPIKAAGHTFAASSITWMELSTDLDENNFEQRRRACAATLVHADAYLPDTERYLADIWGIELRPLSVTCRNVLEAIANATSIHDVEVGRTGIAINTEQARQWRRGHYDDFVSDITKAIRQHYPEYATRTNSGQPRYVTGTLKEAFRTITNGGDAIPASIWGTRERCLLHCTGNVDPPSEQHIARALVDLQAYGRMYPEYLYDCATRRLPDKNDWGDLECFIYVRPGRQLFTLDRNWMHIALQAGLPNAVFAALG